MQTQCLQMRKEENGAFMNLLDFLQKTQTSLSEDFKLIVQEINGEEAKMEMPTLEELRTNFKSFMRNK